ncbi:hypothetical protein QJR60_11210 [Paraclostridium sordellii]
MGRFTKSYVGIKDKLNVELNIWLGLNFSNISKKNKKRTKSKIC